MASYLITGTSRGLGLELVRQLSLLPDSKVSKVFAIVRNDKSDGLRQVIEKANGRVSQIIIPDITKEESVQTAVTEVEAQLHGAGLDVLINNAGVISYTPDGIQTVNSKELLEVFNVNVVSTQVITAAFLPLLKQGEAKKIVNVSTTLGSIAQSQKYSWAPTYSYKVTKAAVNMLTAQYAIALADEGFTVLAVSPGWLKTDLGSQQADLEVGEGANAVLDIILKAGKDDNGQFKNILVKGWENVDGPNQYDGKIVPW